MKKLLFTLTLFLLATGADAQYFYHQQMPPPPGAAGSDNSFTTMIRLAGGRMALCSSYLYDSLFTILETDADGLPLSYKGYALHPYTTPDTAAYLSSIVFFPTKDSGIAVTFRQLVISVNPNPTDSNRVVLIKLNKQLNVQWAQGKSYAQPSSANPYPGQLLLSNPASDDQGDLIFPFGIDTVYGLCKIDPAGNIVAAKQTSEYLGFNALPLPGNRTLLLNSNPNPAAGTTALAVYGIDDQLNLYSEKHYQLSQSCIAVQHMTSPAYNHALIALPAAELIGSGGFTSSLENSYLVMDTSGNLLQLQHATGAGQSPVLDVSVTDSNRLLMSGYDAGWYLNCIDTAGHQLYGHNLTPSGVTPLWAPVATNDSSLLFLGYTNSNGGTTAFLDLVRYRKDGSYFCPDHTPFTPSAFNPVAFQSVSNTTPVFTPATLSLQAYSIDTLSLPVPAWQQICIGTGIPAAPQTTAVPAVYTTDGHTLVTRLPDNIHKASLLVTDITGRKILQQDISSPVQSIPLPGLANGIYVWQLIYGHDQRFSGKLATQ